jgi:glycosyltransferase involved in cell wall biosynthesis
VKPATRDPATIGAAGQARPRQVIMLGPDPGARGGMATVIGTLLAHGYEEDGHCRFLPTYVDGGPLRKARCAAAALLRFGALLARGRVALLHVHAASGTSFWRKAIFMLLARAARVPVLFHLHGGEFRDFIDGRLHGRRKRLALWLLRGSRAAFALTEESAAWLRTRCQLAEVELMPNPLAPVRPLPRQPGRDILYIGRLEEKKGVFDLLEAFAQVRPALPGTRLVLAGDGEADAVRTRAQAMGVSDALVLEGWVDAARRAQLLSQAGVFVLPSHHEQMPMVILEAMAAGTPVVATNVGAVAQMLVQGKAGSVVPVRKISVLAAQILSILTDNSRTEKLTRVAQEQIQSTYLVDTVLLRLRRRYQELAA